MQEHSQPPEGRSWALHPLLQISLCASTLSFLLIGLPDILYLVRGGQDPDAPRRYPWATERGPRPPQPGASRPDQYDIFVFDDGRVELGGPRRQGPTPPLGPHRPRR